MKGAEGQQPERAGEVRKRGQLRARWKEKPLLRKFRGSRGPSNEQAKGHLFILAPLHSEPLT